MEAYVDPNIVIDSEFLDGENAILVNFVGCNFNCPICNAPDFVVFNRNFITNIKEVKKEIKRVSPNVSNIVFSGGEPTLQRLALGSLCRFANKLNLSTWVHTNGSKPEVIKYLIKNNLSTNFIVSIKAPLDNDIFNRATKSASFFVSSLQMIESIKKSIDILYEFLPNISVEFRTPVFPGVVYKPEHFLKICRAIAKLHPVLVIENFSFDPEKGFLNSAIKNLSPLSKASLNQIKKVCTAKYPQVDVQARF